MTFEQDGAGYWRLWCIIREFKIEERRRRQSTTGSKNNQWKFTGHDKNVSLGPSWRVVVFHRRDIKVFGVAGKT